MEWYDGERLASTYPDTKNDCSFMVIRPDGEIHVFDGTHTPVVIEDGYVACGSGRDYAMAAMYLGCDAKKAVEVACAHDTSCGRGIDVLELVLC